MPYTFSCWGVHAVWERFVVVAEREVWVEVSMKSISLITVMCAPMVMVLAFEFVILEKIDYIDYSVYCVIYITLQKYVDSPKVLINIYDYKHY